MNTSQPPNQRGPSITLNDLLYTVFRHKWKILLFSLLGAAGALAIWFTHKPVYRSNAAILVRYVAETRSPLDVDSTSEVIRSPDSRGATVVSGEVAILQSIDGIRSAVETVGAARILGSEGGETNLNRAVARLAGNLQIDVPRNSSVINVSLKHGDPEVAQRALDSIIKSYLRKHIAVHRSPEAFADLQQQTETVRLRLLATEEELRRIKNSAEVISLPEAKLQMTTQLADLQKRINETQATLAERQALLANLPGVARKTGENATGATNETNSATGQVQVTSLEIEEYRRLVGRLGQLKETLAQQRLVYTDENRDIQALREQIAQTEEGIASSRVRPEMLTTTAGARGTVSTPGLDLKAEIASIEARFGILTNQFAAVRERARRLDTYENQIVQRQRQKELEEAQYTFYAKSLEQARLDQALDASKLTNIGIIQEPTFGAPADSLKRIQLAGAALGVGILFGIGLALLSDYVLNPSIRRTKEIAALNIPVYVAVPDFGRNGHSRLKKAETGGDGSAVIMPGEIAPWDEADPMLPYYEAIRDRLVMSYGEDLHRPKIVGLTSCHEQAGVTRIASGLAAALSRDVKRDVLFIGLEKNRVLVSSFSHGRPSDGKSHDGQENGSSEGVKQNLYSLATTGRNLSGASVVQSFSELMPRLRASDYEYIIFDLPPLSQTSGSIRLATQMERMLLVVEAEKTAKQKVVEAKDLLNGSKTQIGAVLNRSRQYGPRVLNDNV